MSTVEHSSTITHAIKTDAPEYIRCETHCEGLLKRLQARPDLCDMVLIVGDSGKRISAHRLILIASSDYFSALLSGPMRESQDREITLNEVDGDALEQLVNYCYTGCLELQLDSIMILLRTANYLQLNEVTDICCEFLQRHLQSSNCLTVGFFAEQLNLEDLLQNSKKFIFEHFEEVSNHPEFFVLTAKQLSEFIASDDLHVPSEEFVFGVVMKWIEHEPENRRTHFTELLALVRLPLLPPAFLVENVEPLCSTTESQQMYLKALKSHLRLSSNSTHPRNYQSKSVVKHLLAIYSENHNLSITGYDLCTKVWTRWNTPIQSSDEFAVTVMDDNLVVVGGSPANRVTSLNLRTLASTELAPLITDRSMHSVAVLNGSIYAIGGFDGYQDLNSVERWDPASRTWNFVAPIKTDPRSPGVAVINDHLYVSGGEGIGEVLTSMECYDPVENIWRSTAPMKVGRYEHCLAAHKGFLFAIGGDNYESGEDIPIERYDPRTDTWTTIPCSHRISGHTRCASLGPDLFIYNGSKIYMLSSDGSCDQLELQILRTTEDCDLRSNCIDLVAIPFKFSPPESWIRN